MGRTACTEPQCLYEVDLYLLCIKPSRKIEHTQETRPPRNCCLDTELLFAVLHSLRTFLLVLKLDYIGCHVEWKDGCVKDVTFFQCRLIIHVAWDLE